MSASTERKNRVAAREAGTDKKTIARREADKKAARSKLRWTVGTILVALLLAVIILLNTGFIYTRTTAATVGDRSYSPAELQYHYVTQYSNFMNQYGAYASMFGIDTSYGITGLASQPCSMMGEGKTWRDYFLDGALNSLRQIVALNEYARNEGISLDESELAELDEQFAAALDTAKASGISSLDRYFTLQFGEGVTEKVVRRMTEESLLASKAMNHFQDSLAYSDAELEEYYASLNGERDLFDYAYYYVPAARVETEGAAEGEDAEAESAVTEQTLLEARMTAEAIQMAYQDGSDIEDPTERFNAAIEAEFDGDEAELITAASGSSLSELGEWLRDASRKAGDLGIVEDSAHEGYYVVLFLARSDNHYPTVSVRHILIKAVPGEDGSYSEEAKQAALVRINEIRREYEEGEQSEESFAALAEKYSEDSGSNTNGGLYEDIYKGEMVPAFNDFCFAPHKHGDIDVVYGESGSYAGYHLVYFVGEGDLYSNVIARGALSSSAVDDFLAELVESFPAELARRANMVK